MKAKIPNKSNAKNTSGDAISETVFIRAKLLPALAYTKEPGIIPIIVTKK